MGVLKMALTEGRYVVIFSRLFPYYFICNRSAVLHGMGLFVYRTFAPVQHSSTLFLLFPLSCLTESEFAHLIIMYLMFSSCIQILN